MSEFVTDHFDRYLQRVAGMKSDATHQTREKGLRRFNIWLEATGRDPLELSPLDIEDFLVALSNEDYAPNTISSYFTSVRLFYKFLDRDGVIDDNPAADVDQSNLKALTKGTKKHQETDIVYVTKDEFESMVENVPSPKLRNRLILRLLWQTGLRRSELASIQLDDIDREERSITIYSTKTDHTRTVYYQESLDFLLDQWLDNGYRESYLPAPESPYLFTSERSEQISGETIGKVVLEAAESAGCQEQMYRDASGKAKWRITAHAIRHGHAVQALKSGIDIRTLQKHLGHRNLDTTERYLRLLDDDVKEEYRGFET
ncbi:tyrosine-type recombinase/integrase [Halobacterium sp. CBA1126]|uniref:tyrosine-type recombinase/integrase n=1 Tax=Halobacterium sp. CBA1126 TaxID=2668074 RepID=UPI0012F8AA20|nr:tyrosine-type recombinase/integrase [Halobacterium sp. CBA1126]MUV60622.1 tyrosine-type recombinase/integrase [Halobacterium sp. CBA1126]